MWRKLGTAIPLRESGQTRIKPPHLAEVGLFKPTLVNNVESFAAIPYIVLNGGKNMPALEQRKAAVQNLYVFQVM